MKDRGKASSQNTITIINVVFADASLKRFSNKQKIKVDTTIKTAYNGCVNLIDKGDVRDDSKTKKELSENERVS